MRITILFLLIPILSAAQDVPRNEQGLVEYSKVIDSESDKETLYSKARSWFVDNFNDADAVIQLDDKELGKIQGKGIASYPVWRPGGIDAKYTVLVLIKDKKVKISTYDIEYRIKTFGNTEVKYVDEVFQQGKYLKKDGSMKTFPKAMYDGTSVGMQVLFESFEKALNSDTDEFSF